MIGVKASSPGSDEVTQGGVGAGDAGALVVGLLELALRNVALDVDVELLGSDGVRIRLRLGILEVLEVRDWLELERTGAERLEIVEGRNCGGRRCSQSGVIGKNIERVLEACLRARRRGSPRREW